MDTLLRIGLANAVAATLLALLVAGVSRVSRRPALAHGLWLLVLLKLLTPPLLAVPLPRLDLPELKHTEPDAALASAEPAARGALETRPAPPQNPGDQSAVEEPAILPTAAVRIAEAPQPPPVRAAGFCFTWTEIIGGIWVTSSLIWLGFAGLRLNRFRRFLSHAQPAPTAVQEQARRLSLRLGLTRCPAVCFVPGRVPPMLWALAGAPRLLLPVELWTHLSESKGQTLLAHELAHLRRRDHWVRYLELSALCLYWWCPVAWWAQRQLQEAEEQCCDAWVVEALPGAGPAYAEALVETMAFLSRARVALPVGASGAGRVHRLKRRLNMILDGTTPKTLSLAGLGAVLSLGALLLPMTPGWGQDAPAVTQPQAQSVSPPVTTPPGDDTERAELIRDAREAVKNLRSELSALRESMQSVERRLRRAQDRLARLEGRPLPVHNGTALGAPAASKPALANALPRLPVEAAVPLHRNSTPDTNALPRLPVEAAVPLHRNLTPDLAVPVTENFSPARAAPATGSEYDRRLSALERKLDMLLKEMQKMRKSQEEQAKPSPDIPRR